jgi:CRP-like cAMP-binding protein
VTAMMKIASRIRQGSIADLLGEVPLFARCTTPERRRIARLLSEALIPAGEYLCRQDSPGRQVFIVLDGEADVLIDAAVVNRVGPGEIVGEMAVLDHALRVADVVAVTPMRVLAMSPAEFYSVLDAAPGAAIAALRGMGSRLRDAERPR